MEPLKSVSQCLEKLECWDIFTNEEKIQNYEFVHNFFKEKVQAKSTLQVGDRDWKEFETHFCDLIECMKLDDIASPKQLRSTIALVRKVCERNFTTLPSDLRVILTSGPKNRWGWIPKTALAGSVYDGLCSQWNDIGDEKLSFEKWRLSDYRQLIKILNGKDTVICDLESFQKIFNHALTFNISPLKQACEKSVLHTSPKTNENLNFVVESFVESVFNQNPSHEHLEFILKFSENLQAKSLPLLETNSMYASMCFLPKDFASFAEDIQPYHFSGIHKLKTKFEEFDKRGLARNPDFFEKVSEELLET